MREDLTDNEQQIIDLFTHKPHWALREIAEATGINPNTAKKLLKRLVEKQYLSMEGKGRSTRYCRSKIL